MLDIDIRLKKRDSKPVLPNHLGFGKVFTDHVFEMDYNRKDGWHNLTIKPFENLSLHPATAFMHYGQAIFEGLKAFKTVKNEIVIFRPDKHFERLNNSARRLVMPEVNVHEMINILKKLIAIEKDWMPEQEGQAMYIRPFMLGVDEELGVKPSRKCKFLMILSPVGAYYPEGYKPVKILVQDDFVRTIRKGMGECKTGGNYAASLLAQEQAKNQGFTQVLWLDGVEQKHIEEVGTMNIFIQFKDEIVTPKLTGGILSGITRMTVLQLLKDWNMKAVEREVSIFEFMDRYDSGEVLGVFGTGTAAVISSIGELKHKNKIMKINNGEPGELDIKLFKEITSIQFGIKPDKYNWLTHVDI
jgi:branched-chain amino acid aminotransferase